MAVKVFRLDIIPEQAQVLAEALSRATESSLVHPSIVGPLASGIEGTVAYRAEEYVAAESLDVAMRHYAPASIEKALPFITQLANAVDFARAAGVGHGGLHPRDIFVTPDEARATGFGVVEALEQVGIRAPIRRPYSAPERIAGSTWGTPADVFALAAITFELLTARRPAGTGTQIGALQEGERTGALHAVLARAMDDDPARRYPTALAFAGALAAAARGEAPVPGSLVPKSTVSQSAASPPVVAAWAVPAPVIPASTVPKSPIVPPPGEFEVEDGLDPVAAALDDAELDGGRAEKVFALDDIVGNRTEPTLFNDDETEDDLLGDASADEEEPTRFAEDFVEEVPAAFARDAEPVRHPAEEPVYAAERPMFSAGEPQFDEAPERSGPAVLPFALGLVLGLLGGFALAYFIVSRDRPVPPAQSSSAVTAPQTAPAPAGPATPEKPGQYSEQKVTPPPVSERTPAPSAPPSVTRAAPPVSSPAAGPRAASTGQIVVRSTPPRAFVTVNGKWRGRTPLTVDGLPFGSYVVRVVHDGFRVAREEVTLNGRNASQTINTRLERDARPAVVPRAGVPGPPPAAAPASTTGSLYVDSRPHGATVLLDGKSVGVTPLSLAEVSVGSHVVRIEMDGKKPWTSTALVTAGKRTPVTGSLEDR